MNGTLQGGMAADVIGPAMLLMLVGAVAIGILALLAKIVARTSVYSITSRRLVMRVGVALPITINIPFVALAGASLRNRKDGAGDIILELLPSHRISWIALWPHCGGWSFGRPKPMLRGIANALGRRPWHQKHYCRVLIFWALALGSCWQVCLGS